MPSTIGDSPPTIGNCVSIRIDNLCKIVIVIVLELFRPAALHARIQAVVLLRQCERGKVNSGAVFQPHDDVACFHRGVQSNSTGLV